MNVKISLLSIVVSLIAIELIFRVTPSLRTPLVKIQMKVEPESYLEKDKILGFRHKKGVYNITYFDSINTIVTINQNGNRVTKANEIEKKDYPKDYFFGCSFTFGHGLNDNETFCWKLQEQIQDRNIQNFGVGGAGTLYNFIQLKNISKKELPQRVIFFYASFHNMRNTWNQQWQASINVELSKQPMPFGFIKDNALVVSLKQKNDLPFLYPLFKHSSIYRYYILKYFDNVEKKFVKSDLVTIKIFEKIKNFCDQNSIELLVIGLTKDDATNYVFSEINKFEVKTLELPFNLNDGVYLFEDGLHPNALSNELIAMRLKQLY